MISETDKPFPGEEETPLLIFNPSGYSLPVGGERFRKLLDAVGHGEGISFGLVELVFVDREEIVRLNRQYLGRDYVTDIISFGYGDEEDPEGSGPPVGTGQDLADRQKKEPENRPQTEGTLYCCAPRIAEQAAELGLEPEEEFCRIFIHGLLHLAGYDDRTKEARSEMSRREDHYLKTD